MQSYSVSIWALECYCYFQQKELPTERASLTVQASDIENAVATGLAQSGIEPQGRFTTIYVDNQLVKTYNEVNPYLYLKPVVESPKNLTELAYNMTNEYGRTFLETYGFTVQSLYKQEGSNWFYGEATSAASSNPIAIYMAHDNISRCKSGVFGSTAHLTHYRNDRPHLFTPIGL